MIELGQADKVVELGRELIACGIEQVGQSHDEGETANSLADCLQVVFDGVEKSSLSPADKLLFAIDACLQDDYDILGDGVDSLFNGKWKKADWSIVADQLGQRLKGKPADNNDDFHRNYQRDCLTSWLANALMRAGREDELLAIYETEARITCSYERLVNYLVQRKQFEQAQTWACEGIVKTIAKLPGIAASLARVLCDVAKRRKQWDVVAAHAAYEFFDHPGIESFNRLAVAAKVACCEEKVVAAARHFLESGELPFHISNGDKRTGKITIKPSWPLPVPDYLLPLMTLEQRHSQKRARYDVLLEMAIVDKQPAEVLRWYEVIVGQNKQGGLESWRWHVDIDRMASAIAPAYPERALEIHRNKLEAQLKQTGSTAYENCIVSLRAMRAIYKQLDREDYWTERVADIRHQYRNRPRFIEMLDKLAGKTIVESMKSSARR
jgi:uncharacterized Zn finger protein